MAEDRHERLLFQVQCPNYRVWQEACGVMGNYSMGLKHEVWDDFLEEVVFQQRTEKWVRICMVRRREPGCIRAKRQERVGWLQKMRRGEVLGSRQHAG